MIMSQAQGAQSLASMVEQELSSLQIVDYLELVATVLYCYDFSLTVSKEFKTIWTRRFSIATLLFIVCRYTTFINRGVRVLQLYSWHNHLESQADLVPVRWFGE
ncbi:hypothetical protein PHLGIDRAFT_167295 [Phlebiopsis gigantea 11061_1 CR5-6]|uniref:DUF6533 domain-containing protein n=1 Tax=Phlebiopsis gigantea (strain 11061_1 CR5-6) TaxID=745531 RepID=A0A0C3S852_PHLG1|nr:hypothetical protein PHLGIDRAFT_167295 [Phlebiopsis gigantea 11061_1 CR5-6]